MRNSIYGYQIMVPKPYSAHVNQNATSAPHGLSVRLSPDAEIIVWAEYTPYDDTGHKIATFDAAVQYSLKNYAANVPPCAIESQSDVWLDTLPARRLVLECGGRGVHRVFEIMVALRRSDELLYELLLKTTPAQYESDNKVFSQIAAKFRVIKIGTTLRYLR